MDRASHWTRHDTPPDSYPRGNDSSRPDLWTPADLFAALEVAERGIVAEAGAEAEEFVPIRFDDILKGGNDQ